MYVGVSGDISCPKDHERKIAIAVAQDSYHARDWTHANLSCSLLVIIMQSEDV